MSDFALRRHKIEALFDYEVIEDPFDNGSSQRRLVHPSALIGFKIESPVLTYTTLQDYLSFFNSKFGALTSFTFTSPFDNTEYTVKFRRGSFSMIYSEGHFICRFEFERVW